MTLRRKDIRAFRKDPANYRYRGMIYHCDKDPYLILPKQIPWMGWTINFAHPRAKATLIALCVLTPLPILLTGCISNKPLVVEFVIILEIIALSLWSHWKANEDLLDEGEPIGKQVVKRTPRNRQQC